MSEKTQPLHPWSKVWNAVCNLVGMFLMLAIVSRCYAIPGGPGNNETVTKPSLTAGFNVDPKVDVEAMDKYEAAVRELLDQGKFTLLDQIASSLRSEKARFAGGPWKLYIFYRGLKEPKGGYQADDSQWDAHLARLGAWAGQNPSSVTALIALAEAYFEYAEKGRVDDTAASAPGAKPPVRDLWEQINSRVHSAKLALRQAEKLPTKCPHYYFVKQKIIREPNSVLLQEARAFEPTYYYYYRMQALLLHLDSDADPEAAEKFADEVSSQIGGDQGAIAYYEIAATLNGSATARTWPRAKLSWAKVQQGYAALEKVYGTSVFKANQMAFLALRARDMATAKRLLAIVGDRWAPEIWQTSESFASAKLWASAPAEFATALQTSIANQETSAGQQYFKSAWDGITQNHRSVFANCMQQVGQDRGGNFDLVFEVNDKGLIQEVRAWPQTKWSACLSPLLLNTQLGAPPSGSFWLSVPFYRQEP